MKQKNLLYGRLLPALLVLCLVVGMVPTARAAVVKTGTISDGRITWTLKDDGSLNLVGEGAIIDEPRYNQWPWLNNEVHVTSVVFDNRITTIQPHMFGNQIYVERVTLPSNLTSIGNYAFSGCTSLKLTELPDRLSFIGESAFLQCTGVTISTLPPNISSIGKYAFQYSGIAITEIPDTITYIGEQAFMGCKNLALKKLPSYYKNRAIEEMAFMGCENLALSELPSGVNKIGERAFGSCAKLQLTKLPDSLTTIDAYAFVGCESMAITSLPSAITKIGAGAFSNCTNLALTALPSGLTKIEEGTFAFCGKVAVTELPAGVTSIGSNAFKGCTNLALTKLPMGITTIESGTFSDCTNLVLTELPAGITAIGASAFLKCTNLALKELPAGLSSIGADSFLGCKNLVLTKLPASLNSIGKSVFLGCSSLALTELPAGLISIGDYAFLECDSLALTELPAGLSSIGVASFQNCVNLVLTELPASLSSIGNRAFALCEKQTFLNLRGPKIVGAPWDASCTLDKVVFNAKKITLDDGISPVSEVWVDGMKGFTPKSATTRPGYEVKKWSFDSEGKDVYTANTPITTDCTLYATWGVATVASGQCGDDLYWALTVDNVLTITGTGPMWDYTGTSPWYKYREDITTAVLDSRMTSIGIGAFSGCKNLTLTELPPGITDIGNTAFFGCTSLALTELPAGLTSIKDNTFYGCTNLALNSLPSGITTIGGSAFQNCTTLALRALPSGVTSIESATFQGCTNLALEGLPNKITNIGGGAFQYCINLKLERLPDSIETIDVGAFLGCTGLALTELPPLITEVNDYTFEDCKSLALKSLPSGLKSIGKNAFMSCLNLELAEFPAGLTFIGQGAFSGCGKQIHFYMRGAKTADTSWIGYIPAGADVVWNAKRISVDDSYAPVSEVWVDGTKGFAPTSATTRPGYEVKEWSFDSAGNNVYTENTPIASDCTLYAIWRPCSDTAYKVQHYVQDVTGNGYTLRDTDELTGTTDATVTASPKTYTGFAEYTTHADRVPSGSVAPDGSTVLRLYYNRNLHSVSYDTNGGSSVAKQSGIRFEATATEPTPPTKTGYDFGSWWADAKCTIAFDFDAPVTTDVTVYASWLPRADTAYKVLHYTQDVEGEGYTLRDTDELTGTTDAAVTASAKTYTGFTELTTHADRVSSGSVAPDGSTVLRLYYNRAVYTLSFDPNGGAVETPQKQVIYGLPYGDMPTATWENHTFIGWYTRADGGAKLSAATIMDKAEDSVVYALWANDDVGVVDGDVTDQDGKPVADAKIIIRAGAVDYKTTRTDATGRFTITAVKYGNYNLVVEKEARIVTSLFAVQSSQVSKSVVLPNGITNSVIIVEDNTPEIVVGGLDNLFGREEVYTKPDSAMVDSGGKVELRLNIAEKKSDDTGVEGKELAQGASKPLNMLLEMSITKEVYAAGADTPTSVESLTELPELMTIIIPLAEEQQGKNGYTVFRAHHGSVDEISEEPNAAGEYISVEPTRLTLYACKFSLYAMAFDVSTVGDTYTITATAGQGGTISPAGRVSVNSELSKTFTITPDTGHRIADVLVDGKSVGAVETYKFTRVRAKHTIEAVFYCPSIEYADLNTDNWYHADVDFVLNAGYMRGVGRGRFAPEQTMTRAELVSVLARLSASTIPTGGTTAYADVPATAWFAPAVAWAHDSGVGIGYSKRYFAPGDVLTREQLALMLYRYAGGSEIGSSAALSEYSDGSSTSRWAADAMVWAVNAGILQGDGKGRLAPTGGITRAEVAAILRRFLEPPPKQS